MDFVKRNNYAKPGVDIFDRREVGKIIKKHLLKLQKKYGFGLSNKENNRYTISIQEDRVLLTYVNVAQIINAFVDLVVRTREAEITVDSTVIDDMISVYFSFYNVYFHLKGISEDKIRSLIAYFIDANLNAQSIHKADNIDVLHGRYIGNYDTPSIRLTSNSIGDLYYYINLNTMYRNSTYKQFFYIRRSMDILENMFEFFDRYLKIIKEEI
jgi:hypothetical protein